MQNENSRNLVEDLLTYHIHSKHFDLDYGIVTSRYMNKSGLVYTSLQFGVGDVYLDIQIYNKDFIIVKLNKNLGEAFFSINQVKSFIDKLQARIPPQVKIA